MDDVTFREQLLRRLNVLISLQLETASATHDAVSLTAKISRLNALGLSSAEIAAILGKPSKDVSTTVRRQAEKLKKRPESAAE